MEGNTMASNKATTTRLNLKQKTRKTKISQYHNTSRKEEMNSILIMIIM